MTGAFALATAHCSLWLYWTADRLPGIQAATQGICCGKAPIAKLLCHTGTRAFLRSGSVNEREKVLGPGRIKARLAGIQAYGSADFHVTRIPDLGIAHVQDRRGFPGFQLPLGIFCANRWE